MNAWLWLGIAVVLVIIAFGIGYRFAPKGLRTKLSNLLMAVGAIVAAVIGVLADVNWTEFGDLGPVAIAVLPVVVNYINKRLRDVTTTPGGKLF